MGSGDDKDTQKYIAQLFTEAKLAILRENKLEEEQKNIDKKINILGNNLSNKIDAIKGGINVRIDGLDTAFRGNGRIGVFEQIRSLRLLLENTKKQVDFMKEKKEEKESIFQQEIKIKIEEGKKEIIEIQDKKMKNIKWLVYLFFSLMVILIGGEVFGLKLGDIKSFFGISDKPETKMIQSHIHDTNTK